MRIVVAALAFIRWGASGLEKAIVQNPSDKSRRVQERCPTQAQKVFKDWKDAVQPPKGVNIPGSGTVSEEYQSHYNSTLNRCVSIQFLSGNGANSKSLVDAYENRVFAYYLWVPVKNKHESDVPPVDCDLIPVLQEKRACNSEAEYNEFVAAYVEQ
jgi:hypothetical protein